MFAPRHHAAMAHVVPVRKALGVRTIFNFLGPLTNPAGADRQLLGVSDRHYQETIAEALVTLGSERAMVVAAEDGLDELSISARTRVIEVAGGGTAEWFVEPGEFGLGEAALEEVAGGTPGGERRRLARRAGRARAARAATSSCSTPARRSTSAGRPRASKTASPRPPRRSTRARRGTFSTALLQRPLRRPTRLWCLKWE